MKKIILSLGLAFIGAFAQAQNGLESIIVEKYYVSNAADAAGSVGVLPTGSVTYRIYADMLPGYEFQAAYGVPGHNLVLTTTTSWFNNEDRGATSPTYTKAQAAGNSVMLDSWLSAGAGCVGNFGVLKSEDGAAGGTTVPHASILQNADPSAGIPLTVQDGLYAGSPEAVTFVGLGTLTDQFDATSQLGNSFITSNGSWASLNGSSGPLANNKVLIAQITTDGIFHYELNIQIGTPSGGVENYVASSPVGAEITIPSLTGTLGAPNSLPTINITAPIAGATYLTGDVVNISANAADTDGTVDSVVFFVDGVRVGVDASGPSPYTFSWTSTVGTHNLTARAYDNSLGQTTSTAVQIIVGNNISPTVAITAPANGATMVDGLSVAINATANDADGTVDSVVFFVNGVRIGVDNSGPSPYSTTWTSVIGTANITAVAYDNNLASTTSATVTVNVFSSSSSYAIRSSNNACSASGFCLPIDAIVAVDNVIGYDIVVQYNNTKVTPTGVVTVSNDLITLSYTSTANSIDAANGLMYISVFFNSSAPVNAEFNGLGELLCVEFVKTANFTSADTAQFSIVSLQESYANGVQPKVVSAGSYTTFQPTLFTSNLIFWSDNSPIRYNPLVPADHLITNIYGDTGACGGVLAAGPVQPDLAGNFTYDITKGTNINIQKDILNTTSVQPVVNGFDAFLTRRVLINDASFLPSVYQMIAMDVNIDGVISAGDLSQINQRAVLILPEFKQSWNYDASGNPIPGAGASKDWLFIDGNTLNSSPAYLISATFPFNDGIGYSKARVPVTPFCLPVPLINGVTCLSIGSETYSGILVGDVNGNFATTVPNSLFRVASGKIVFDVINAKTTGNVVEVPVSVESTDAVNALDFAMKLNSNLKFHSVVNHTSDLEVLTNFNANDNTLRFTSNSLKNYDSGKSLVTVRFTTINGQVNANDLAAVEGYLNGERAGVSLTGAEVENNISVYPNPSSGVINVVVPEDATIQLFGLDGRQVMFQTNVNANEKQEINIQNLVNGVYMLKVSNDNFITMKKVVVKK